MTSRDFGTIRNGQLGRRGFLETVGATAFVGTLAGCTGDESGEESPTTTSKSAFSSKETTTQASRGRTRSPDTSTKWESTTRKRTTNDPATCDTASAAQRLGTVPVHRVQAMPARAEIRGISNDERQAIDNTESRASAGSTPNSYFELDGMIDGRGTLGMSTGATFTSYWRAPADGRYTVSAAYFGTGAYQYAPPEDEKRDYTIYFASNLSISENCHEVIATRTHPDLRHANQGLRERAAEELLEFLAYRLVAPYLGLVGRFIAKQLIDWMIDLDFRKPTEGSFFIDPAEPHVLDLTFDAQEGETYALQFTPSIGFVGESKADWILTSDVEAKYLLDSLSIRRE